MASPASSEPAFLTLDGAHCRPAEWTEHLVDLQISLDEWERIQVAINGETVAVQVRRLDGASRVVVDWPRSPAGHYRLDLRSADGHVSRHRFEIPPAKLSSDALDRLLADLHQRLPHALAVALQRGGALAGLTVQPLALLTAEAEAARLRRIVLGSDEGPGLIETLGAIAQDPHRVLRTIETVVPLGRARRPHPASLRRTLYTAHEIDDENRPMRLPDRRVEPTVDVAENRLVRAVADLTAQRLSALALAGTAEVGDLIDGLTLARRRASFLDQVAPLGEPTVRPTLVMIRRPAYRRALELWRLLTQGLAVTIDDIRLAAPFQDLPSLYETWGTLLTIEAVAESAVEAGYRVVRQDLIRRKPGHLTVTVLPGGCALALAHPDGRRLRVLPQASFGPASHPVRSVSFMQIPDVAVEAVSADSCRRLLLFDPKYKLRSDGSSEPAKEDIDKMHAYRDSIVSAVADQRLVEHAAILYPGPQRTFGDGVSAIGALPDAPEAVVAAIGDVLAQHLG